LCSWWWGFVDCIGCVVVDAGNVGDVGVGDMVVGVAVGTVAGVGVDCVVVVVICVGGVGGVVGVGVDGGVGDRGRVCCVYAAGIVVASCGVVIVWWCS